MMPDMQVIGALNGPSSAHCQALVYSIMLLSILFFQGVLTMENWPVMGLHGDATKMDWLQIGYIETKVTP